MRRNQLIALLGVVVGGLILPCAARAQTCAANVPHVTGTWVTLPYQMPINPISATLLRTGKVLIVAGSENDAHNNSEGSESYRAAVWDPTGTTQSSIGVQNLTYDVFCSGTASLPDGRALVVGGTSDYSFTGDNRALSSTLRREVSSSPKAWWTAAGTRLQRRSETGASWRSPGSSSPVERTTRWRSMASGVPEPDGAVQLLPRPSVRPCTLEW